MRVNKSNIHGNTALHYACYWRYEALAVEIASIDSAIINIGNNFQQIPIRRTSYQIEEKLIGLLIIDRSIS